MDIEDAARCFYDYLQIYDGSSSNANLVGKYCGTVQPTDVRSTGNKMFLNFHSDDRQNRRGFKLTWKSVKKTEPKGEKFVDGWSLCLTGVIKSIVIINKIYAD